MKTKNKQRKIRKYKSKKYKRKFIGGRDKHPIQISGSTFARPDMKSFSNSDPGYSSVIEDMKISCDKVDENSLLDKLLNYPYFQLTKPMKLVLFPYCNEEIKQNKLVSENLADRFDLVNKPLLDSISMNAFKTAFGEHFSFDTDNVTIQDDDSVISPPTNVSEFIKVLKDYIEKNFDKKGIFIVSHSGFMTNLMIELLQMEQKYNGEDFGAPDLYTDMHEQNPNIAFDNLDMIHIQYDKKNKLFLNITIRRYRYQYNIDPKRKQTNANEPTETNITRQEVVSEDKCSILNIFIMRHCLACHNLSSSLIEKASQYMFNTKGYLNYSLCLRETCFDLLKVKNNLLNLFRSYCFFNNSDIRLSEIVFGSSVIFRAILTCSLVFNSLTRPESSEQEIERLRLITKELIPKSKPQTFVSKLSNVTNEITGTTDKKHAKVNALVFDDDDDDDDSDDKLANHYFPSLSIGDLKNRQSALRSPPSTRQTSRKLNINQRDKIFKEPITQAQRGSNFRGIQKTEQILPTPKSLISPPLVKQEGELYPGDTGAGVGIDPKQIQPKQKSPLGSSRSDKVVETGGSKRSKKQDKQTHKKKQKKIKK
tara:strand:- start:617 stop:2395 length:1779 start_codon:yes stop_codon:yes gene_type:complete